VHRPSVEVALDRDMLCSQVAAGPRDVRGYLGQRFGISMARVEAVCREYPEIRFRLERRYNSELSDYVLSIEPEPPPPEPVAVMPAQPAFEAPPLSPEEMARATWRPPAPGMQNRRVRQGSGGIHRERHPLVSLPNS
jgi:hypothetical protein